jgi:hypothetical protein
MVAARLGKITMKACAVLLASYVTGVQISDLDKSVVYEVPASFQAKLSWTTLQTAKACAYKHGIRWRIVQGR